MTWQKDNNGNDIFIAKDAIEEAKKELLAKNLSREELWRKANIFDGPIAHQKAAALLLDELDKKDNDNKHTEVISEARKATRYALWAVIAGLLGALIGLKDCSSVQSLFWPPQDKKTEIRAEPKEQTPITKAKPEPEIQKPHKETSRKELKTK